MLKDLIASAFHPSEISAMFQVKYGGIKGAANTDKEATGSLTYLAKTLNDHDFCFATLNKVSRSFAVVIQQLPAELKTAICVFYLVLRGLDSVEDDMTFSNTEKIPLLQSFHSKLYIDNWSIENVGDSADYRILLANFHKVINVFKYEVKPQYQSVISEICRKMGHGMADYASKLQSGVIYNVDTIESYNQYCFYVAGLVGLGLCQIYGASGLEDNTLENDKRLWNAMGMFLQKTNIIRDYLDDLTQARMWWPKQIWSNYAAELQWFSHNPDSIQSVQCLNHMINDALQLVPDVLQYLNRLHNVQIFEFCAIPQVMAMATLAEIYNNHNVFKRVVKIRKGLTCKILLSCGNKYDVYNWFNTFARQMQSNIQCDTDTQYQSTQQLLHQVIKHTRIPAYHINNNNINTDTNANAAQQHTSTHVMSNKQSKNTYFNTNTAWCLLIVCAIVLYTKQTTLQNTPFSAWLPSTTVKSGNSLVEMAAMLGGSISVVYLFSSMFSLF